MFGRRTHLVPNSGLRRILSEQLQFTRLEDAPIPLHVVATDVVSGTDVLLSSGNAVDAIAASAAIPGVFPPVNIDGRDLMDGGVVNNTPVSHAVALGADRVWVLPTGYSCDLPATPKSAVNMALHAMTIAFNHRLADDVSRYRNVCRPARHSPAVSGRHFRSRLLARGDTDRAVACRDPRVAGGAPTDHRPGRACWSRTATDTAAGRFCRRSPTSGMKHPMSDDPEQDDPPGLRRRTLLTTAAVAGVLGAGAGGGGAALLRSHGPGGLVSAGPHRRATGGRSASAIRPGCRNRGGGVLAHNRGRPQSAGHAGRADVRVRQHRGGRNPNLPGCQVQHRGSCQPRAR